ncbi:MAG: HI1506-related protein [Roseiarcus sp.]|jgi:hypothetical protein
MAAKTADPAAPASAAAAPAMAGAKGQTITVRGPEDGRWRAGLRFGPIEVVVDLSTITPAQLAAIKADPKLSVKSS